MRHHDRRLRLVRRGRRDRDVPPGAGALTRRTEKLGDVIQAALADLVRRRAKDPGLHEAIFSFTGVDVSPDLARARVHVSVLGDAEEKADVLRALGRSAHFLHRELTHELHIRRVPELQFDLDESIEEGDRITSMMRDIARSEGRDF